MKKRINSLFLGLLAIGMPFYVAGQEVEITTNVGVMRAKLYEDVPHHVQTFVERAKAGAYDGTLFTRVIRDFMIQGGAPDSRGAAPGQRVGFGDRSAEILPEATPQHFHKRGALAAPRQNDDINPKRKSDMSQFFIVQGRVYRSGELDTLELIANQKARKKALDAYYYPVKAELTELRKNNPREFNKRAARITAQIDSVVRATPGHLIFTPAQREAYTTVGGAHHLDGQYVVYGELTEGFDVLEEISRQPTDKYDRPKQDIQILHVKILE